MEPDFRDEFLHEMAIVADEFLPMPEELDDLKKRLRTELDKILEK